MFLPYLTLGYVTDGNAPVIRRYGIQNFLFNTIGNTWQLFNCNRLRLRMSSSKTESPVNAIAALDNQSVCTGAGRQIVVWKRNQEALRLTPPLGNNIVKLMAMGNILLSLSKDNHLYTWDLNGLGQSFGQAEIDEAIADTIETATDKKPTNSKIAPLPSTNAFQTDLSVKFEPVAHTYLTPPSRMELSPQSSSKQKHGKGKATTVGTETAPFVTSWTHPPTYQNKIVIGWSNGVVELWNILSAKMVHRFTAHLGAKRPKDSKRKGEQNSAKAFADELAAGHRDGDDGDDDDDDEGDDADGQTKPRFGAPVTCLESANILDIIAVGCANGNIFLLNLKLDELVHRYHQSSRVTALSFRSEDQWNNHMVSAGENGSVTLWDLKAKSSVFTKGGCHSSVSFAQFLFKEPILITSGTDNAIIQWHFNGTNMTELRSRSGHSKPPSHIKWYAFNTIISGGNDASLRYWSPNRDRSSFTLSWKDIPTNGHRNERGETEGYLDSKERRIRGIELAPMYHQKTPSCVTLNSSDTDKVTLWSIENKRAEFLLGHSPSEATNTCFTHCGQYIFIAYADGEIKKYNLQSKALRASYTPDRKVSSSHGDDEIINLTKRQKHHTLVQSRHVVEKQSNHGSIPHQHGVQDMYCAQGNEFLISIGKDGLIHTWDIDRDAKLRSLQLDGHVHASTFAAEHALLAVITTNNDVYLVDCDRLAIVREWKFSEQFLPDGRSLPKFHRILLHPHAALLFLADNVGGMNTIDLTSGVQIDYTIFSRSITSFDICPPNRDARSSGDILATTHTGSVGVYLWVLNPNRQLLTSLTIHQQHLGDPHLHANHIALSSSNKAHSIDAQSLAKEQERFQQAQAKLILQHQTEATDTLLGANEEIQSSMYDDTDSEGEDDGDESQGTQYKHTLNPLEHAYFKKMKESNHFLTINVVRNMSMFDNLITKPKPASKHDIVPNEDDSDEDKLIKIQRVIQQVLFKQLHNEMNAKLAMLSGISSSRWKLLATKQAIAQRNEKIKQSQILVNKDTPFFLNIKTAQKKQDSSTTYQIDGDLNLSGQISSIQNAHNSQFTSHRGGASSLDPFGQTDEPADFITQCLNLHTVGNISSYLWPNGSSDISAIDSDDDDDDDDVFVSVNDKPQASKTKSYSQQEELKKTSRKQQSDMKRAAEKEKKAKLAAKALKREQEQKLFENRRELVIATLEHHYLHIKPEHPTQSFVQQYITDNAQQLKALESNELNTTSRVPLFSINPSRGNKASDLSSIISKATAKSQGKAGKPKSVSASVDSSPKTEAELLEARRELISQAFFSTLKDLHENLGLAQFSHTTQRHSLSPLISYVLTTPPSVLSMQIADSQSERDLYILLHTLSIIASTKGMLDAVSSLLQHTLELHSLTIAESPLLRLMCVLLTKSLSAQWKWIEMLLHSNIAAVNQLSGLNQGF